MDLIVVLISFDIIASKFLDSYITSYRAIDLYQERNPVLAKLLSALKIDHDAWLSFFFTILMVGIAVYFLNTAYASMPYQLLFILTGLFTTTLNLGAAHSTYFGKKNFITRRLLQSRKLEA